MATAEALMTAEEFGQRPDPGYPEELVEGRIVTMPPPGRMHGYVCGNTFFLLQQFVGGRHLGRVLTNDTGVITGRGPDTVRGADVAYYSYERLPREALAEGYGPEVPELVVEVRSKWDRWIEIHEKVAEYLAAGVTTVIVLDPKAQTAHRFGADDPPQTLRADDDLTLPGVLEGFSARVSRFFE